MLNFNVRRLLLLGLLFCLTVSPFQLSAFAENSLKNIENIEVLLVNPSIKNDPFWHKTEKITRQAAIDLRINLTVIYGDGTRFFQLEELKNYFKNNASPDYVILINYPGHAKISMDFLQNQKVKIITLEQTLSAQEKEIIGQPGQIYKRWLGEIYFGNKNAGYLLAENLISFAISAKKKPIIAGISGNFGSESNLRNEGLLSAIVDNKAKLTQIVHANWSAEDAYDKTLKLLRRYPDINILWCASDHMALAAIEALKSLGLKASQDVFVGGFDWTDKAIESISQAELTASVGGHFMMGAIAMLAIYDEQNDIAHQPFASNEQDSFSLTSININNIKQHLDLLSHQELSHINFKKLAKLYASEKSINAINLLKILERAKTVNKF